MNRSKSDAFCSTNGSLSVFVDVATEGEGGLNGFDQIVNGRASVFSIPCELGSKAWFMGHEDTQFGPSMGWQRRQIARRQIGPEIANLQDEIDPWGDGSDHRVKMTMHVSKNKDLRHNIRGSPWFPLHPLLNFLRKRQQRKNFFLHKERCSFGIVSIRLNKQGSDIPLKPAILEFVFQILLKSFAMNFMTTLFHVRQENFDDLFPVGM